MNFANLVLSSADMGIKVDWGFKGLVIGLSSVFAILVLLIVVINLLKFSSKDNSKAKKQVKTQVPVEKEVKTQDEDENQIIAVIAAAISCIAQREGKRYAIKTFKRIGSRSRKSY